MNIRNTLLATAAASSLIATAGYAAPAKKHHVVHHAAPSANSQLLAEVKELRAQVDQLRAKVDNTATLQDATNATVTSTQAQVQQVQTQVAAVTAAPPVTPEEVHTQIAGAIEKEHHNGKFYFKGITITPGGFLEAAGIYRQNFQGNDISSSFSVPFANSKASHTSEGRFTARQSRVSFLAQGDVNKTTSLSMYGEFDFQGGAQTANSNQSNSYNPRIRVLYGTLDWNRGNYGIHVLAGQNWSLLTLQSKGISPRAEVAPSVVDAGYVPGFAWARQPGVRIAADFLDHKLWLAASAENPQTTLAGTVPANLTYNATAGSGFDSANSLSLNHVPDFIGKAVYEDTLGGHLVHVEGFGIYRSFDGVLTNDGNVHAHGGGYGGSINMQVVPGILDAQFSGFRGKGIGRYGSAGLPDVTVNANGQIKPIEETMLLAGMTAHASKALDIYAYAGEEQEDRKILGGAYGLGLLTTSNAGCFVEGGTCSQNTRRVRQVAAGFWDKFYQGSFGRAQIGIQYSYTQRQLFEGAGYSGYPEAHNSMGFVSFRYYPF